MNTLLIYLSVIFGALGFSYFLYGKRRSNLAALVSGLVLCVIPYCIHNAYLLIAVGTFFLIIPFLARLF